MTRTSQSRSYCGHDHDFMEAEDNWEKQQVEMDHMSNVFRSLWSMISRSTNHVCHVQITIIRQ